MWHVWMSHVTHHHITAVEEVRESYHIYEWVMLQIMSTRWESHVTCTGWRRVIGCLIFIGHFPKKNPTLSGSLAKPDLQLEASYQSLPPCINESLHQSNWRGECRVICLKSTRWGSHVTCMNESCHTLWYYCSRQSEGVILHISMSHEHMNELCYKSSRRGEGVISHVTMSDVTHGVATISRLLKIIGLVCRI